MFKSLFVSLLFLALSSSLSASVNSEEAVLYGDFVNCYYELHQDPSLNNFVGYQNISYSNERLQSMGSSYKRLLEDTNYDAYVFSYEGLYGIKASEQDRHLCDGFQGWEGKEFCAFDFKVKAGNSSYDLCYAKQWLGDTEKDGSTYIEDVYTSTCKANEIDAVNVPFLKKELSTERLSDLYFSKSLLPSLQSMYTALADQYIWGDGFRGDLCINSATKTKSKGLIRQEAQSKEDRNDFLASYKQRVEEFNDIVLSAKCYPACKKLGVIIEIEDNAKKSL